MTTILPRALLRRLGLRRSEPATGVHITVNVETSADPAEIARQVGWHLRRMA